MKTKTLITTAIIFLAFILIPNLSTAKTSSFHSAISKTVKYPAFASENGLEATIWIQMIIMEDGTIEVEETNHACCQEFLDQVVSQLDGTKIKNFEPNMVGVQRVKFVFNIEE